MWRNYWTVAVRALAKSKTYSVINIAGLAIGMAACIMILLYIHYERSYDKWLPGRREHLPAAGLVPASEGRRADLPANVGLRRPRTRIKKDFPQVADAVYALGTSRCSSRMGRRLRPKTI